MALPRAGPAPALAAILLALLLALLLATPQATLPARAQDRAEVRLSVTELTSVLGPGAVESPSSTEEGSLSTRPTPEPVEHLDIEVLVENRGDVALTGLRLVVEVFPAIERGRSVLQEALDEGELTRLPTAPHDEPLLDGAALEPGAIVGAGHTVTADEAQWDPEGGVHPVRISVLQGSQVVERVDTAVVYLADTPVGRLLTTMVWPLDAEPWRLAGGGYPPDVDASIRDGGRLDRLVAAVEAHGDAGVMLAPAAHLLEDLRDRADGFVRRRPSAADPEHTELAPESQSARRANTFLQRMREVAGTLPLAPIAGAYGDADLAGLTRGDPDLTSLAGTAVREGRRRLDPLLDRQPEGGMHLVTGPVGLRALDLLPDQVVMPWSATDSGDDVPSGLDHAVRSLATGSGRRLSVSVADPYLTRLLAAPPGDHGPIIAAQRILVETAMVFFEAPSVEGRALTLLPPLDWAPDGRTAERLLGELSEARWLTLDDPSAQSAAAPDAPELESLPAPQTGLADRLGVELALALADLEAARDSLPEEVDEVAGRSAGALGDQLLLASSRWYAGAGQEQAEALIADVRDAVDTTFGEIDVTGGTRVTLTSDSGEIPVTLHRTDGGPLDVRVEVQSQGRLVWPEGRRSETLTLAADGTQTVSFATRALSRGTFPVSVRVTDVTGTRVFDSATLSVRATAISRPALVLTGGTVLVLLLVGLARRRPRRRPALEVVGGAEPDR